MLQTALAAAPIAAILGLMLGLGWSAARAGVAGLVLALVLAFTAFGWGADAAALQALAGVGAEGGFIALTILWILWPALALHEHQRASGALDSLRAALTRLSPDPRLQVVLVGWFLALFLEGAAGFGTPVALAAPLLVGLGVPPLQAVVLALLGHALGVSFGALGTPVAAQVALTGLTAAQLAWRTALLNAAVALVMAGFFAAALRATGLGGVAAGPQRVWPWMLLAALSFVLPSLALALLLGPELPTLGGALLGGLLFAAVLHWRGRAGWPARRGPTNRRPRRPPCHWRARWRPTLCSWPWCWPRVRCRPWPTRWARGRCSGGCGTVSAPACSRCCTPARCCWRRCCSAPGCSGGPCACWARRWPLRRGGWCR
jgi:lactate permease